MKNLNILSIFLICTTFLLNSCKKKDSAPLLSTKIQQIVNTDLLNKMKIQGMPINEGLNPPNIEGIFVSNPHTLVSTYAGDSYQIGHSFADLTIKFSNQNSKEFSVSIDTKNSGNTATGIGGFVSGTGSKFSLFAELTITNTSTNSKGKQIRVFSGEITPNGIKDFYSTLVFTEKNDPKNYFLKVGDMRIIKDGNGLASKVSNFRLSAEDSKRNSTMAKKDENTLSINTQGLSDSELKRVK